MVRIIIFSFFFIFLHISSLYASKYNIYMTVNKPEPIYQSVPAETVRFYCAESEYIPAGCTHYETSYKYTYKYKLSNSKQSFTSIDIDVNFYYKDLTVYMDEKLDINSCEYNALKKHEELHIKTDLTVEEQKIKSSIIECIAKIEKGGIKIHTLDYSIKSCIQQAYDLDEKIRKDRNKAIDRDESKKADYSGCK